MSKAQASFDQYCDLIVREALNIARIKAHGVYFENDEVRRANPDQRDMFVDLFRRHLEDAAANALIESSILAEENVTLDPSVSTSSKGVGNG
jgi:hypothetical protein